MLPSCTLPVVTAFRLIGNSVQSTSYVQQTTVNGAGGRMGHTLESDVEVTRTQFEIPKMQISFDNQAFLVNRMRV